MKNLFLLVATMTVLAIAGGNAAQAQVADPVVADIPFGFTVRDTTFPAGEYTIKRLDSVDTGVMEIRSADGNETLIFLVGSVKAKKEPNQTELVFDRVGDQYFLSEIFEAENDYGVELRKSRTERKLEKEGAISQIHSLAVPGKTGIEARR